ncbi:MAG: hypothetical protein GY820_38260 [Gammaproteobacteria bacterium]|nr:hypothetical protein [Gammaproteobacteria bacterium]
MEPLMVITLVGMIILAVMILRTRVFWYIFFCVSMVSAAFGTLASLISLQIVVAIGFGALAYFAYFGLLVVIETADPLIRKY